MKSQNEAAEGLNTGDTENMINARAFLVKSEPVYLLQVAMPQYKTIMFSVRNKW